MLNAPFQIISPAGVMHNAPGIDVVDRMYYLYGERDRFPQLGEIVFRDRWKWRAVTLEACSGGGHAAPDQPGTNDTRRRRKLLRCRERAAERQNAP